MHRRPSGQRSAFRRATGCANLPEKPRPEFERVWNSGRFCESSLIGNEVDRMFPRTLRRRRLRPYDRKNGKLLVQSTDSIGSDCEFELGFEVQKKMWLLVLARPMRNHFFFFG